MSKRALLLPIALLLLAACGVAPAPTAALPITTVVIATGIPVLTATTVVATGIPVLTATPTSTPAPVAAASASSTPAQGSIIKKATETVAATPSPTTAPAAITPAGPLATGAASGRILFASTRDSCYGEQIYVIDAAGGVATRLTSDCRAAYRSPVWSPDGTRIAFIMATDGAEGSDIYTVAADGSDQARITSDGSYKHTLAWSPDGSRFAFAASADGNDDIFVVKADGSSLTRLTDAPLGDTQPSWSPDGARIVFRSERDVNYEIGDIYVMNADGSGQTRLTSNEYDDAWPVFSPDGATIAFTSNRDDPDGTACWHTKHWCNYEVYTMSAAGGGETRLTDSAELEISPAWAPDGTLIAFAEAPSAGEFDIHIMSADGSGQAALTEANKGGMYLSWAAAAQAVAEPPPTDTPTATATATATPVPVSPYAVAPVFAKAALVQYDVPVPYGYTGETGHNALGAPLEEARQAPLARQWFGPFDTAVCRASDSLMLWRGDTREIAFLLVGSEGSSHDCYPDYWLAFQDTYQQGDPNNEDQQPPAGYYVPAMGFGKVWREELRTNQYYTIGLATTEERHTDGTVQRFENGTAYYFPDTGEVYILFDRFRRVTVNGEFESLVWLAVQ